MVLKQKYLSQESAIASYEYQDISSGSGVIQFKGFNHVETATTAFGLTTTSILSNDIFTASQRINNTLAMVGDYDFDIVLNLQQTINGSVYVNIPVDVDWNTDNQTHYVVVRIRRDDGAEHEIASAQSETQTSAGAGSDNSVYLVEIPITNQLIKAGETLRLTIETWMAADTGAVNFNLGHDPANRTLATTATSILAVNIPFVIDL